jgi:hypothetical protein
VTDDMESFTIQGRQITAIPFPELRAALRSYQKKLFRKRNGGVRPAHRADVSEGRLMQRRPLVDRVLGAVGLARKGAPARRSVYAGARVNAQSQDWFASMLSADRAIKGDFRLLRERARELGRDNPHVARYRGLQADNVIGPDGIRLQAMVRKPMAQSSTATRIASSRLGGTNGACPRMRASMVCCR